MNRTLIALSTAALLAAFPFSPAHAHCDEQHDGAQGCVELRTVALDDLEIADPWTRVMQPGQQAGGGYLAITNRGNEPDRLIHASTPRAARTEIHSMEIVNDVMTMRPVDGGLEITAGETLSLEPGGYHVMFIGVAEPFVEGQIVPVTLEFETAGRVDLEFEVRGMAHGRDRGHSHEMEHGHDSHDHGHDHGEGHSHDH
ncbi:MAG: copper chaperone PCu(A)C [Rhizobiaceae bacterium]